MKGRDKFYLSLLIIIIILFFVATYLKYTKIKQPSKEDALKKGFGYYTADESLGCVNDTLKCSKPGTETIVQYCIPNPVTGRGCIDLDGKESYNMVIKTKPCNIHCNSQKWISEDNVQVQNISNGTLIETAPDIVGSGCNKIIDPKFGIDYTNYFLGDYDKTSNKYDLKSCIPEDFTGYYQKIYTCVNNDDKGDNNCRYSCGTETGLLTLSGLFSQKLSSNLLKYFPSEIDGQGNERYVCLDINGVDQIEILNYKNKVPSDFTYPNICYKHSTVYNYNGELWPNSGSSNNFTLNNSAYQPDSDYITLPNSLNNLLGIDNDLINKTYNIYKDYNSYVKILLSNELTILDKVVQVDSSTKNLVLYNNSSTANIVNRETYGTIYFYAETNKVPSGSGKFSVPNGNNVVDADIVNNINIDSNNFLEIAITSASSKASDNFYYTEFLQGTGSQISFFSFAFFPNNSSLKQISNNTYSLAFNFTESISLSSKLTTSTLAFIYLEIRGNEIDNNLERKYIIAKITSNSDGSTINNITNYYYEIEILNNTNSYISSLTDIEITSQIYIFNSNLNIRSTGLLPLEITGSIDSFTIDLTQSFKTGNVRFNEFLELPQDSQPELEYATLKYTNADLYNDIYIKNNFYSLTSGNTWTVTGSPGIDQTSVFFQFVSKGKYNAVIENIVYYFVNIQGKTSEFTVTSESVSWTFTLIDNNINNGFSITNGTQTYNLTPENNLLLTKLYYVYGTDKKASDNQYFYHPMMLTNTENEDLIQIEQFPMYKFNSVNITFSSIIPPENTDEFTYLNFNEESGFGDCNFEYTSFYLTSQGQTKPYFIRNLSRRTNLGNYPEEKFLFLYNDKPQSSILNKTGFFANENIFESNTNINTLKLIRRNSDYFQFVYSEINNQNLTYQEKKIIEYMSIIEDQNNNYSDVLNSDANFNLIIFPQKTLTIIADYRVFKSPYTIDEDGKYSFPCFTEQGVPKAKGTTNIEFGLNDKLYFNKGCTDYNVDGNPSCGILGIKDPNQGTSIVGCVQDRSYPNSSFEVNCLPYTQDKYTTINDIYESGIILREMFKAQETGGVDNPNTNILTPFFTREEELGKFYQTNQELYINKNQQNFYLSLKNNNTEPPGDVEAWEQVFLYQNLTPSVTFQNHFYTDTLITTPNNINLGLGLITKNESVYNSSLVTCDNFSNRLVFKNNTTGLNTQNFIDIGVRFYFDFNISSGFGIFYGSNPVISVPGPGTAPQAWDANVFRIRKGEGNWFSDQAHYEEGQTPASGGLGINQSILKEPTKIGKIFNYVAKGEIVKVLEEGTGTLKQVIQISIQDSNLFTSYSDIEVGDYVNIDDNFFGEIFQILYSNTIKLSSLQNDITFPDIIYSIETTRNLFISLNFAFEQALLESVFYINVPFKKITNFTVYISNSETTTSLGGSIGFFDKFTVPEKGDIIACYLLGINSFKGTDYRFLSSSVSKNFIIQPEFIRILNVTFTQTVNGSVTLNSYEFEIERNIKNTPLENLFTVDMKLPSPNPPVSPPNIFCVNLKNSGNILDGFQEIVKLDEVNKTVVFNVTIDRYEIISTTPPISNTGDSLFLFSTGNYVNNVNPDVYYTPKGSVKGGNYGNANGPINLFNYNLSLRYIKKNIQPGFVKLNNDGYLSLTRKTSSDLYNTKLMGYITSYYIDGDDLYLKEFREDYGYGNPQIERTFEVGDIISYSQKFTNYIGTGVTQENINTFTIGDQSDGIPDYYHLQITEVDVTITNLTKENVELDIFFDYKCKLVNKNSNFLKKYSSSSLNPNNVVPLYTPSTELAAYITSPVATYQKVTYDNNAIIYQLPYAAYPYDDVKAGDFDNKIKLGVNYGLISRGDSSGSVWWRELSENISGITQPVNYTLTSHSIPIPTIYVDNDYYKILFETSGNNNKFIGALNTDPAYANQIMYPGNVIRGNRLDTIQLVSTNLKSVSNPDTDYVNITITSLTGKPYGSSFILNPGKCNIPNHNRFGTVNSFELNFDKSNINSSTDGDIFESGKGFQMILTNKIPSSYNFLSIGDNDTILPFQTDISFSRTDIISTINRNTKQYFRNISSEPAPFSFPDNFTSNFEIVPKTIYPEDNFVEYNDKSIFEEKEIVNFQNKNVISGLYQAGETVTGISPGVSGQTAWTYQFLTQQMKSDNKEFYSFVYNGDNVTAGPELNNIITKNKELNNQNFPLQINTFVDGEPDKNYCPNFCSKLNKNNIKTDIDESFVGQLDYFKNIKYLFEDPMIVKKEDSKKYLSLGNIPVSYNTSGRYNINFLSSSDDTENLVSQFVYLVDLDNSKSVFNKPGCSGNFIHYDKSNPGGIDSGVSSFEFSNSLIFQFLPCSIDTQDYVKYQVIDATENVVKLLDTNISFNKFPPEDGFTQSGGTSIPLISEINSNYSGISGGFNKTFINSIVGSTIDNNQYLKPGTSIIMTGTGSYNSVTMNLSIEKMGSTFEGKMNTLGNTGPLLTSISGGTSYVYGDLWYATQANETQILTYGFVVPNSDGSLDPESFIQLREFIETPTDNCNINIISESGSGFKILNSLGESSEVSLTPFGITQFSINSVTNLPSPIPSKIEFEYAPLGGPGTILKTTVALKSDGTPVQPGEAIFTSSSSISEGEIIYVPSYNVEENIKVKTYTTFGKNYFGKIKYNNQGFRSLDNVVNPTMIFDNYSNYIFSNNAAENNAIVVANNNNLSLNNLTDVMLINFKNDGTFGIQTNSFTKPIGKELSNISQKNRKDLGVINSNSVNVYTSESVTNMIGVSVKLDFDDFISYNQKYNPVSNLIPGNTNTQIQIGEIKQNRTTDYIEPQDNCSIYFDPYFQPTTDIDNNSVFFSNYNPTNEGGNITLTISNQVLYPNFQTLGNRFNPSFDNSIVYQQNNAVSFTLGNNLIYFFDQTDITNNSNPIVFSTQSGNNFLSNIIKGNKDITPGSISFEYFLDFKEVTYEVYTNKTIFNNATQQRKIRMLYTSKFQFTNINIDIFYGSNASQGEQNGGKFQIIYH